MAEKIRVDRASALRLLLDDMQAAQLNGSAIDVAAFIKASEELERLAGGDPERRPRTRLSGARDELAASSRRAGSSGLSRSRKARAEMNPIG